jgi:hypothetical protein
VPQEAADPGSSRGAANDRMGEWVIADDGTRAVVGTATEAPPAPVGRHREPGIETTRVG